MPDGYRERRMTPKFAGIVLMVAMSAGCGQVPVHLFKPATLAEAPTPVTQVTSASTDGPPRGASGGEVEPRHPVNDDPPVELPAIPSVTPLLDSALARVENPPGSASPPARPASATMASPIPIPQPAPESEWVIDGDTQAGPATPHSPHPSRRPIGST